MLKNPTKALYTQLRLHSQAFHRNLSQISTIRHFSALPNSTPRSLLSSSTSTLHNPLHHHPLFPSKTQRSHLSFKTYSSSTSSENHIYTKLPSPFTLAHRMCMRFIYPTKGILKLGGKVIENAEKAVLFCVHDRTPEHYLPKFGDACDGGGIKLSDLPWGERALDLANEVLLEFGKEFKLYAFACFPYGCVYVRIESLSDKYGCPSVKILHSYFVEYRKRLVKDSASGILPDDLGVEVGSPGPQRLLKVPDDLSRFKDLPLRVYFVESDGKKYNWVLFLSSVEKELGYCVWTNSDYDPENENRPITRKENWTIKLPFEAHIRVTFFVGSSRVVDRR